MSEPAAWGILRVGGGWVAIFGSEAAAETSRISLDVAENWVHEAVPLYRLSQPPLTDAEREAVVFMLRHAAYAADIPAFQDSADYRLHHDALRGLLERLSPPAT